jgi:hypothetical protein
VTGGAPGTVRLTIAIPSVNRASLGLVVARNPLRPPAAADRIVQVHRPAPHHQEYVVDSVVDECFGDVLRKAHQASP